MLDSWVCFFSLFLLFPFLHVLTQESDPGWLWAKYWKILESSKLKAQTNLFCNNVYVMIPKRCLWTHSFSKVCKICINCFTNRIKMKMIIGMNNSYSEFLFASILNIEKGKNSDINIVDKAANLYPRMYWLSLQKCAVLLRMWIIFYNISTMFFLQILKRLLTCCIIFIN